MNPRPLKLSFLDHLEELRARLIKIFVVIFIAACLFYPFADKVLIILIKPIGRLIFTSPADAFMARITLTIFGGLLLSFPFILYQIWQFVACGLKEKERRYALLFGPCSLILFVFGGLFAYFVMVPFTMRFLLSFSSDLIVPMITIKNYISFVGTLIVAFGIVFELPLVLMFLTKIGIATPAFLVQKRRHAIVLILIVSALITPPDVITQLIMAIPLMILYELGVVVSKLTYRDS